MTGGASRIVLVSALFGAVAGCAAPPRAAQQGSEPALSQGDYRETGRPAQTGQRGGTLRVSAAADTGTLDLHSISHTNAQWLGRLIFDNLVYLDDQGRPTPWLARSWDISPDGKTYTFHLRKDVTFSDGAPFDADAVLVNLQHMRDPATKSPLAAAYIAPYESGRVIDRYTFEARLRTAYAPFLNVLAQSWLAMISPRQIHQAPKTIASHPIGSGPFVVESYKRQQGIRLVRRERYDWAPDFIRHAGHARVRRIEVDFVPEGMIRYAALASGQYDLTIDAPPQNAAAIRADTRLVLDNRVRTGIASRAVNFNVERAPFDDIRVRQALAFAVGRSGIAHANGFGEFRAKTDFLASNTADYAPDAAGLLAQDLGRAGRLLDAAGWTGRDAEGYRTKGGRRLGADILVTESATLSSVIVALQADARAVGFEFRIVQLTLPMLTKRRMANDYQALAGGVWHTNTPDALYINYQGGETASKQRIGQNVSRLHDPQIDAWLAAARESQDPAERQRLYALAQRRLVWLAPGIPLYENHSLTAHRRTLHGILYDTSHNTPVLTGAWVEGQS